MPHPQGLITLLTDFGDRDSFVASMKGVILTIHPNARIVDLSHQIMPHQIEEAGYVLHSCYRSFPDGTIHVAVVDPGVGSARRPLLVATSRCYFIAPDNGLLTRVLRGERQVEIRQIEQAAYRLQSEGATFDGRDLFAPAAAWLASGRSFASFGRLVDDPVELQLDEPVWRDREFVGRVVSVDRFGNLISNITAKHLDDVRAVTQRKAPRIRIAEHSIEGLVACYSEGRSNHPCALMNSHGWLELFIRESSAARAFNVRVGEPVRIT
ncbi:MAG: SAM-dependent chlorinase/fluorinase [Nitrospirota bacterium]|nr:SAM-dependent chlorinase/fluorinase [Nitrospirota bacterium]